MGRLYRILSFPKGFHGLVDIPAFFQARIDTTLELKHPPTLVDIIIVTQVDRKNARRKHLKQSIE